MSLLSEHEERLNELEEAIAELRYILSKQVDAPTWPPEDAR